MTMTILTLLATVSGLFIGRAVLRFLPPAESRLRRIIPYIVFIVTAANRSWIGDENPLLLSPFFLACFLYCYRGPWYARLVTGMIFFSLLEPLCMIVDSSIYVLDDNSLGLLLPPVIKLVLWGLVWLLCRRLVPEPGSLSLPGKFWGLLGVLCLAPLFSTLSFTIWKARDVGYDEYFVIVPRIAYTILPFALLSAIALLVAVVVLSRHEQLEQQQMLAELQQVYYKGLQREQNAVRSLRHDLHNHIAAARGLLERGDTAAAGRYLAELSASPALVGSRRYCENNVANALIAEKLELARQKGVDCNIQVSLPEPLAFPDVELCALLGNALDNAIEAAEVAQEKRVCVQARADKGMLMLRVENTLKQTPREENGALVSSKRDSAFHGYGVAGMQELARRHGGACKVSFTESEFCLVFSAPLEQ